MYFTGAIMTSIFAATVLAAPVVQVDNVEAHQEFTNLDNLIEEGHEKFPSVSATLYLPASGVTFGETHGEEEHMNAALAELIKLHQAEEMQQKQTAGKDEHLDGLSAGNVAKRIESNSASAEITIAPNEQEWDF